LSCDRRRSPHAHASTQSSPAIAVIIANLRIDGARGDCRIGNVEARGLTGDHSGGTQFLGTLRQTLSTRDHIVGNRVEVRTTEPFRVEDVNLPSGLSLRGEVTEAKDGGRVSGESVLSIRFTRLAVDGREYQIVAEPFRIVGKSETKNSLKKVIGGTVAGGVVGAIAGNTSKGLLLGAAIGSGVAVAVATKGGHIMLPAGRQLAIRLAEPVVVTLRSPVTAYPR